MAWDHENVYWGCRFNFGMIFGFRALPRIQVRL